MIRKLFVVSILLMPVLLCAQEPVTWNHSIKEVGSGIYEIHLKASVKFPWHIYSQKTPEGGPIPTSISFTRNPVVSFVGSVQEKGVVIKKREEVFGIDVMYYDREVEFVQIVKVKGTVKTNIKGSVSYMVCNDGQCLPPAGFQFDLVINR